MKMQNLHAHYKDFNNNPQKINYIVRQLFVFNCSIHNNTSNKRMESNETNHYKFREQEIDINKSVFILTQIAVCI